MPDYVTIIYTYLPMTLVVNLIYYLHPLITESGKILPIIAQNLGLHSLILPILTWGIEVADFVQGLRTHFNFYHTFKYFSSIEN